MREELKKQEVDGNEFASELRGTDEIVVEITGSTGFCYMRWLEGFLRR